MKFLGLFYSLQLSSLFIFVFPKLQLGRYIVAIIDSRWII